MRTVARRTSGRCCMALLCAALAACGAGRPGPQAREYLEEESGSTITALEAPLVFALEESARAANVRDYLYAAPLAVNQAGQRTWWLWLAQWSTLDHGVVGGAPVGEIGEVQLLLDGEPMDLDGSARLTSVPGVRSVPYAAPVASARTLVLPLTASQVTRLGRARDVALRSTQPGGGARVWPRWSTGSDLQEFAALAIGEPRPEAVRTAARER